MAATFRIRIQGVVQGVGFRPFVYRLAVRYGLQGWVRNDGKGVLILVQGEKETIDSFSGDIKREAPPLARISGFHGEKTGYQNLDGPFEILASTHGEKPEADIARDSAICDDCLAELRNPIDFRYNHPFVNCTNCGPRYTILEKLPYDRPHTTMKEFPMCSRCAAEYSDPSNRRFHAQPICCPECGPQCSIHAADGSVVECNDPVRFAAEKLNEGCIVAIKGLGGYHLACRADLPEAVTRLRKRKQREEKPFALMVPTIEAAQRYGELDGKEKELLMSPERPILIAAKKNSAGIAEQVAPRVRTFGIMLPYTPIHYLLFGYLTDDALVMTSGNRSGEPICRTETEAFGELGDTADCFLTHDREIALSVDDSIVRVLGAEPVLLRRSRGYVPSPLPVRADADGIVALGAVKKNTVAVGRGQTCYVSHYLGAAESVLTLENCARVLHQYLDMLGVTPGMYACDLHEAAFTRALVENDRGLRIVEVQHHHAHALACMAENNLDRAVCVVYDGAGMGTDSTQWGGELLFADHSGFVREGHCATMLMPGGDQAVLYPHRMAIGALYPILGRTVLDFVPHAAENEIILQMLESEVNCVQTSSMGRLFDSMSALLQICTSRTYEGQPAIELEGIASRTEDGIYECSIDDGCIIDGRALLYQAVLDRKKGTDSAVVARRFHNSVADATINAVLRIAEKHGTGSVCLSGGCFQNALLFEMTVKGLRSKKLDVHYHRVLPPGDECISYGQMVYAAHLPNT